MDTQPSLSPSQVLPGPDPDGPLPVRMVMAASRGLLAAERLAIMGLMFLLSALILVNVATRYARMPIYWIDEAAVYAVVWLTFIGASAMTRLRLDFAVTLLTEKLSPAVQRGARALATGLVVAFALALASGRVWQGLPAADRELITRTVKASLDQQIDELAGNEPKLVEQFKATGIAYRDANPAEAAAVVAEYDKIWLPKAPVLAELRKAGQSL